MKTREELVKGGAAIRVIRESLRLSMRYVEKMSQHIARDKQHPDFGVSHSYLSKLETGATYPQLLKFHSLSQIYRRRLDELLALFGFGIREASTDPALIALPRTVLVEPRDRKIEEIAAPLRLREDATFEQTNLVSRMFESWGKIPITLLERMDLRHSLYGYVGTRDNILFPLIRPGSFVEIDPRQTKVATSWKGEFDRPIYFVELRDGYVCSWCDLHERQLVIIPTPQSGAQSHPVSYPGDAYIVGRVIAVTMRIADMLKAGEKGPR
jgi:transcriptional regulator with XRE-family HTH domain